MSSLISNTDFTFQMESLLPTCSNLTIISAFMTQPATRWLGQLLFINKPKVQLVGRFTPTDFIRGASDLNALRECISNGYQIKALANLHAKIYQIDEDVIFTGSANLTGKGLALVNDGNLESCSQVSACKQSKGFIDNIVESATTLNIEMLDKMQAYLEQFAAVDEAEVPATWPEEIIPLTSKLFVSDFPLAPPGFFVKEYELNQSLPFAQVESVKADFYLAASTFKKTKAYRWIQKQIKKNQSGRDLGFGQISKLLHDDLADDPAPYRKEIKDLQVNLYSYIKLYAIDEIEVYMPGRRSEVLRLREN